jgi:RNA polymerase subunit RPABC4/transcription elongation factor Spt4
VQDDSEEDLNDRELPDESDMDRFDEPDLEACPHCRKLISEDTVQCPHCGMYVSVEDEPSRVPTWMWITAVVLICMAAVYLLASGRWL